MKDVVAVQNSVKWKKFCIVKQELYLSLFFFGSMKFKETRSILIIHLGSPGRNIDNIYHVVQILVKQSLVTERMLSLSM